MVYGLQFIIVGEQEQFMVYGLLLTVYHSWRTRTVMIMSMDQPRTSLLNNFVLYSVHWLYMECYQLCYIMMA